MRRTLVILLSVLPVVLVLAACGAEPTTTAPTQTLPPVSAEEHFRRGNEYAQSGDLEKAVAEYQAVLEIEPDNVSAMTNLGVVYYQMGKLDEAVAQYKKALEIAPNDADIHSNLAAAYVQLGRMERALDEYRTAVDLKEDLAEAWFGLGVVHMQLGHKEEAIQAFENFQKWDSGKDRTATQQAQQYLEQLRGE